MASSLGSSNAHQTSPASPDMGTWHVGMSLGFSRPLILTNDGALEVLMTDVPLLSVGLLGFGVLTFFFFMRKFNRLSFYIFASVIMAFVAGLLDVSQVLSRGSVAASLDTQVSSVLPLLVMRELALAASTGFRFLFLWDYVSKPPRGEFRLLSINHHQPSKLNFLIMQSDMDLPSGNWLKLGYIGVFLKYGLLLSVFGITLLQILWRVVAEFSKMGLVYDGDSVLQIFLSVLFVIKLFANAWLSPLSPRWRTILDYLPVIVALSIGSGVSVGNLIQFQFSETALGRFFQAVELYILIVYIHIASFYEGRTRISMLDSTTKDRTSRSFAPIDGIDGLDRARFSRHNDNFPSRFTSETEQYPSAMSLKDQFSSLISRRGGPTRQDLPHSQLLGDSDMENGTLYVDARTRFEVMTPDSRRLEKNSRRPYPPSPAPTISSFGDAQNYASDLSPPNFSTFKVTTPDSQRPKRISTGFDPQSPGIRHGLPPAPAIFSFGDVQNHSRTDLATSNFPRLPGSPVLGLDRLIRYSGQPSSMLRPSSALSSDRVSQFRQQTKLDRAIADLQGFSSPGVTSSSRPTIPQRQPLPIGGNSSLGVLPAPQNLPDPFANENMTAISSRVNGSDEERTQRSMFLLQRAFRSTVELERPLSELSIVSSSTNSPRTGIFNGPILRSSGYVVTGSPPPSALNKAYSQANEWDLHNSLAVDIEEALPPKASPRADTISFGSRAPASPFTANYGVETSPSGKTLPLRPRRLDSPRVLKLNISAPIPPQNVEEPMAYESPRLAPEIMPRTS